MIAPSNNNSGMASRQQRKHKTSLFHRIFIWSTIGAPIILGLLYFLFARSTSLEEQQQLPRKPLQITEVAPAKVTRPSNTEPEIVREQMDPKKQPHPAYKQPTNPNLPQKKYIPTLEEVENARLGPDGKPRKMSIYKSAAEQALGMIFTSELGSPPPMLPDIPKCTSKEQLEEFLNNTFAYDADASRSVNENRIIMNQVKEELKQYLDEGGDIGGFIDYYVGELRASHEQWKTAQTMLIDMARSGEDAESLRNFRDAANKLLAEKGIKELKVPPSVRRAMEEE